MTNVEIMLTCVVLENSDLNTFQNEELFEFWVNLTNCAASDRLMDEFEDGYQEKIMLCIELLQKEFNRRGFQAVNLFEMFKKNPKEVEKMLTAQEMSHLFTMETNLRELRQNDVVTELIKIINRILRNKYGVAMA